MAIIFNVDKGFDQIDDAGDGIINNAGETITYTIEVTNSSNAGESFDELLLTDPLLGLADFDLLAAVAAGELILTGDDGDGILEPGEEWLFEEGSVAHFTYTVDQDDLDSNGTNEPIDVNEGFIDNLATVQGFLVGPGTFSGSGSAGVQVVLEPGIDIEKSTNGDDADDATGPLLNVGDPVTWQYVVTNTGNVALADVVVVDDMGTADPGDDVTFTYADLVSGDTDGDMLLDVDETWIFELVGTVEAGQYTNEACVEGTDPIGTTVDDCDPSNYFGRDPSIDIEKHTNGEDADTPTGPIVTVGSTVTWTYFVTNDGNVDLDNVVVTDDNGTPGDTSDDFSPDPILSGAFNVGDLNTDNILNVGEVWEYEATGTAAAGQYTNIADVTADDPEDTEVTDFDPSNHFGEEVPDEPGTGMTPGFWRNHPEIFEQETGVDPDTTTYEEIFLVDVVGHPGNANGKGKGNGNQLSDDPTLQEALEARGGGEAALLRASTAGWANASSDDLNYCFGDDDSLAIGVAEAFGIDPSDTTAIDAAIAFVRSIVDQIDNAFVDDDCLSAEEVIALVQDVYDAPAATTDFFDWSDVGDVALALDAMNNMPSIDAGDFFA